MTSPEQSPPLKSNHYDIIIVGGGLVGATLALLLAKSQPALAPLRIALLEAGAGYKPADLNQFDPRVVALTRQSQQLLQSVNAWPGIAAMRACDYTDMRVWDGDGTGNIHFNCYEVGEPDLGHIVENGVALANLYQQLAERSNITLFCQARVSQLAGSEQQREVILESGEVLSASLVVAADGAQSKLRELAAISVREWSYGHKAIVTTVTTERPHQFTAWQRFLSSGPLAFLPLQVAARAEAKEYHCSIVWSLEERQADHMMALDDETFKAALGRAFEYRLGRIESLDRRFCFPLWARHASDYYRPGLVLVGDAAHSIHPLAGQGVNLGFLDAKTLAEELLRARERGITLADESILRRYQRRRKGHNLMTLAVMEGFKRLFGDDRLPLRLLRNIGLSRVDQMAWLKNAIARQLLNADAAQSDKIYES
ncbi:UbiH/UbiF/VisC/COQ6 family ubiquinone biosynthesis hydroxylase [Halioxenophilus sp. WMMB6]|uniref:UbiH/UbiF/VisC/COQ6 family ubiquinone biosynthesis hydroxylase n=1 Tax=Halioxenophilus sp. WMMB6 TaxID=3073815 RepID=UPI00295E7D8D|nr:UbiH/UbiF/VisC/COQ6 family ubiquinone biosynthesis hydroxylase [Halioxenophilus sp. WMMB6]